jgi:hypothetical protein
MRRWLSGGLLAAVVIVALSAVQAARHATGVWYQDRSFIGSVVICALILLTAGLCGGRGSDNRVGGALGKLMT